MHIEDLDIEAMRAQILKDWYEASKPFQAELAKLEILEQLVNRTVRKPNGRGKTNGRDIEAHERLVRKAARGPYAKGSSQPKIIPEIVAKEPGLDVYEVTDRLSDGGYRFTSKKPVASVGQTLGMLTRKKILRAEAPDSRVGGQRIRYYPA